MLRSRFFASLVGVFVLLFATFCVVIWSVGTRWVESEDEVRTRGALTDEAAFLAELAEPALRGTGAEHLEERLVQLGKRLGHRLLVLRPDGAPLCDSHDHPATATGLLEREELVQAAARGVGTSVRYSPVFDSEILAVAQAVRDDVLLGFVRVSAPVRPGAGGLAALRSWFVAAAILSLLLTVVFGFLWERWVLHPLEDVRQAAEAIAQGNFSVSLSRASNPQVRELARAVGLTARRMQDRVEAIRAERNKLVAVLAGMVEGVIAIDRDEHVLHLNEAAARMLQIAPKDLPRASLMEMTRIPRVAETLRHALQEASSTRAEVRVNAGIQERVLELIASPLRDGNGSITGAVLVLHDVSELRRLETVRRDFVTNVSHELKTPLAAIRGLAETMDDDPEMPKGVRQSFLQKIRKQVERLSALVNDLIVLSRLESEPGLGELEPRDLCEAVRNVMQSYLEGTRLRKVALESDLPPQPVVVNADDENLFEIVDNLLSNAVRYTPEGGRITLRVSTRNGDALLEVEDTGIGIDPAVQDRIFERFFRADQARSREMGGTGLGLSIVKHAAENLGGQVSLSSEPGVGSCFRVRIPIAARLD